MSESSALEAGFWRVFGRAMGRPFAPGRYLQAQTPEWDSLRHIELIFELEEHFGVDIPPEAIAELFSDTDMLLAYLRGRGASPQ